MYSSFISDICKKIRFVHEQLVIISLVAQAGSWVALLRNHGVPRKLYWANDWVKSMRQLGVPQEPLPVPRIPYLRRSLRTE